MPKKAYPLILASQSPRREELLRRCGYPFRIQAVQLDEELILPKVTREVLDETGGDLSLARYILAMENLALRKAQAAQALSGTEAVYLAADTLVFHRGKALGKPQTTAEAQAMLEELCGDSHYVVTAVALLSPEEEEVFYSLSEVRFCEMPSEWIRDYVRSGEAMDKAGSYGIQGQGGLLVSEIKGDYYGIMGLPLSPLYQRLRNYPIART